MQEPLHSIWPEAQLPALDAFVQPAASSAIPSPMIDTHALFMALGIPGEQASDLRSRRARWPAPALPVIKSS
jgi:hypothetical protein